MLKNVDDSTQENSNFYLQSHGGGIALEISKYAGSEWNSACRKYVEDNGAIPAGTVTHLSFSLYIHTNALFFVLI